MARRPNTLQITNVELDFILIKGHLQRKWPRADFTQIKANGQLRRALNEASWDAILYHDGGSQLKIEDVLQISQQSVQKPALIVLSDNCDIERAQALMENGAYDVVGFNNLERLKSVLEHLLVYDSARQEEEARNDRLAYERRFKALIEISADTLLVVGPDGLVRFANPAATELFGQLATELVGQNFGANIPLNEPADVEIIRPDAERILAEIRGSKVYWDGENCQLINLRDVTRRREIEQALEESKARYSALLENAGDGIITFDESGTIESFNGAAEAIFGWNRKEVVGQDISILKIDDLANHGSGFPVPDPTSAEPGALVPEVREFVGRNKLGHALALEIAIACCVLRGRSSFIGTVRDISRRKKIQRDLETSEERFRTAFSSAPDPIALTDLDGRIIQINPAFCRLTGYSESELLHEKLQKIFHPEEQQSEEDHKNGLINGDMEAVEREVHCIRKDGGTILTQANSGLIRDSQFAPIQIVEHFRDITEERNLEQQLRQSQKMEAIGQLTGGVAHDFNNLLGIVIGNLDLLREELGEDTQVAHFVETALDASLRGAELNKQMLAFARRQSLAASLVEVGDLVTSMTGMIQRLVGERITVNAQIAADCWPSKIDAVQLQTAIVNLALNSRDAMPSGGTLTIMVKNVRVGDRHAGKNLDIEPGTYTAITVSDTGCGIEASVLDRVFEPFFTTKEVGKGTGLGLSMVFGFIKQSGGHILLESEVGKGTEVRIYLPNIDRRKQERVAVDAPEAEPQGRGHTVLIVEDNERLREMAIHQLRKLNYTVVDACDGSAAMRIINTQRPIDLLFTDIVMPGSMDGVELSRAARAIRPKLPVVFASGFSDPSVLGGISPDDIFLRKPYRKSELAAAINSAIKDNRLARA